MSLNYYPICKMKNGLEVESQKDQLGSYYSLRRTTMALIKVEIVSKQRCLRVYD